MAKKPPKSDKKGGSKNYIKAKVQAAIIELVNTSDLNVFLQRRSLGLEADDKNPQTYTGNEDFIKELQRKLTKGKAERNRTGK
jgi:ribosome-associated translation inhibitor RaiA